MHCSQTFEGRLPDALTLKICWCGLQRAHSPYKRDLRRLAAPECDWIAMGRSVVRRLATRLLSSPGQRVSFTSSGAAQQAAGVGRSEANVSCFHREMLYSGTVRSWLLV